MIKSIAITSLCGGQEVLREFKKEKNISVNKIDADSLDAQIVYIHVIAKTNNSIFLHLPIHKRMLNSLKSCFPYLK